ncbi:MAG: DNA repair protein RadA [Nitriliruptorales bacterium]|nr:DNA repair protein RadA [Nitriliruptorales bacterium]
MARTKTLARCSACDRTEPRWMGRCPGCGAWGTMETEEVAARAPSRAPRGPTTAAPTRPALPIRDVPLDALDRAPTGLSELDRVLGGGLVPGSVTLVGGEPGAGKSTLLLQAAYALASAGRTVLYVSAEESPGQIRLRAERLGALADRLYLASETELPAVLGLIDAHKPDLLVLDSVQTIRDPEIGGGAGGVAQVRACAATLTEVAKRLGMATVLVGHVTKDGSLAGPRVLEHLVDTVCELTGERHHALRLLTATKHRFGSVGEVGCFQMTGAGLVEVDDAGRLFVGEAPDGTTGVAVTLALEGRRPLACEVQALVAPTRLVNPRRVASGLDGARLDLLVAVLERRADVSLKDRDVYASSVGGARLTEPGVDLALCLAIASSRRDSPVPRDVIVLGEVGLAGELRLVAQTERRLAEAARLGFHRALLSAAYTGDAFGLSLDRTRDLTEALAVGLTVATR